MLRLNHLVLILPYFLKLGIPGKPVLAHLVLHTLHPEHTTRHLAHNGEQDGSSTSPVFRVSLPEVFLSGLGQALQLCPVSINLEFNHS